MVVTMIYWLVLMRMIMTVAFSECDVHNDNSEEDDYEAYKNWMNNNIVIF